MGNLYNLNSVKTFLAHLSCFILLAAQSNASSPAENQAVEKYGLFEVELATSIKYINPYLDVLLTAQVTGPGGETFAVDGYWQGDSLWKIRIMPTSVGKWTFTTTSNDPQLNGRTGGFDCVASSHPGILVVNPDHPYTFKLSEGEPFFWMGETNWCLMSNAVPFSDSTFQRYIAKRQEQKFNGIHFVLGTGGLPKGTDNPQNEGGFLWVSQVNQQINPDFFVWMDKRIAYLDSVEIAVGFFLTWAQHFTTFTKEEFERFERYLIARYAAYPLLYWVIVGEFDEAGLIADYNYHGQLIYDRDPYGHLVSNHPGHNDPQNKGTSRIFADQGWFSFLQQQLPQYPIVISPAVVNRYIRTDRIYNMPVVNVEYGYEEQDYYGNIMTPEYVRKYAWAIVTAGGFFSYGHDHTIREVDFNSLETKGIEYIGYLYDFFSVINWWEMQPDTQKIDNGFCLASDSPEYIIYLTDSGSVAVDLSADSIAFQAKWFNPVDGSFRDDSSRLGGAIEKFTSPFKDDAVLHLSRSAQPYVNLKPTTLHFEAPEKGNNPAEQAIAVTNSGGGKLAWQAWEDPDQEWLILKTTSGIAGDSIVVAVDVANLASGDYTGKIRVSDPAAINDSLEILVTLTVSTSLPFIDILTPNGGEIWETNTVHDIEWTSHKTSGNVNLYYSTDDGVSWIEIKANLPDSGSYAWTTPGDTSSTCLVRVADTSGVPFDESDSSFVITESLRADFIANPTIGEAPLIVNFSDRSHGVVASWIWDFGDSLTSIEQNPVHVYDSPGIYTVTLVVSGPTGQDTVTTSDYITVAQNLATIAGNVFYHFDNHPVANAVLQLNSGRGSYIDTTDSSGYYYFDAVFDSDVKLFPSKKTVRDESITGSDALLVLQHLAFMVTLSNDQQFSADVNEDGRITGSDAQAIFRYLAYYADGIGNIGQWRFQPDTSQFFVRADTAIDFKAFLLGDVNGKPGYGSTTIRVIDPGRNAATLQPVLKMSEINAFGKPEIIIPLIVEELVDTLHTLIITIEYDPSLLSFRSAQPTSLTDKFFRVVNGNDPGKVHIAMAEVNGIDKNGELLRLFFAVNNRASQPAFTNVIIAKAWIDDIAVASFPGTRIFFKAKQADEFSDQFRILPNYPNPFNPGTTIRFYLPYRARVTINIFNVLGQKINAIFNDELEPGIQEIPWNARDEWGDLLPSGIYFYRIEGAEISKERGRSFTVTKKMFLLK